MSIISESRSTAPAESTIEGILEWLALAHARTGIGDPGELLRQLAVLCDTPLPYAERLKLLDLFFRQTERTLRAGIPALLTSPLPVPRKLRYRTRIVLDALGILTQDYFNTLAELFAPQPPHPPHAADAALTRLMQAIGWRARLAYLAASPAPAGLWQQLHAAFRSACKLGLEDAEPLSGIPSIRRLYSNILLEGIAQPASFTAGELDFAGAYIAGHTPEIRFHTEPPAEGEAVFWIDPEKDFPAHALTRRHPDPSTEVLYFSCEAAANSALRHRTELLHGISAESLGLPMPAGGQREPEILWRLSQLWGHPAKRRFSRRRQSYRAKLSLSLDAVWAHLKIPPPNGQLSEWMVINESPDGFALMHISGHPEHLEVGQLVALQAIETPGQPWHLCVIRWALSENPEHIELGLQLLSTKAVSVEIALPDAPEPGKALALLLPRTPPIRSAAALVVPAGTIDAADHRVILLIEGDNLHIQELRLTGPTEKTGSFEVFNVLPDDSSLPRSNHRTE